MACVAGREDSCPGERLLIETLEGGGKRSTGMWTRRRRRRRDGWSVFLFRLGQRSALKATEKEGEEEAEEDRAREQSDRGDGRVG